MPVVLITNNFTGNQTPFGSPCDVKTAEVTCYKEVTGDQITWGIIRKKMKLAIIMFMLGLLGIILNRKNLIIILMSIEILLLSVSFSLLEISLFRDDLIGQIFSLYILTVAAAESSIGLAILVIFYRIKGTISVRFVNLLKG